MAKNGDKQGHKKAESKGGTAGKTHLALKDYIPTAVGLRIGSQGPQVSRLQRYLEQFGYLESPRLEEFGVPKERAAAPPPTPGTFDPNTRAALRRLQEIGKVPVSGEVDEPTLGLLSKPRCGFPDTAQYVLQGNKWTSNALTFGFSEFTADVSMPDVRNAVAQAMGLWSAVTPLTFTEVPMSSNPNLVIRFVSGDHGDGSAFDGPSGVLAHAFYPPPNGGAIAGDTHMDDAEAWSIDLPPSGIDLVTVFAHEFGHALGLAHSTVSDALMYPYYGGPHRFLQSDDVAGIQALYGGTLRSWQGWENLGGVIIGAPAAASWAVNRLDTFVRGTDNHMYHKWWDGSSWSTWEDLGGIIIDAPAAVSWGPDRIDALVRGTDSSMYHKSWDGSSWSGWTNLGGVILSGPAVSSWAPNRLDTFVRGTDNHMHHKWWDGSAWSGWEDLGGVIIDAPAAVSWGPNRIDTFVVGTDNAMYHKWWDGSSWSGWENLGGVLSSAPAVASWAPNRLDTFVRGIDNHMYHKWWDGSSWSGWEDLGGVLASAPGAVSWGPDRIDTFVSGTDNMMYHKWWG